MDTIDFRRFPRPFAGRVPFVLAFCATGGLLVALITWISIPASYVVIPRARAGAGEEALIESLRLPEVLRARRRPGTTLVDLRDPASYAELHIDGALNAPVSQLSELLARGAHHGPVIFYVTGTPGGVASQLVQQLARPDFERVRIYEGGLNEWASCGLPVAGEETKPGYP